MEMGTGWWVRSNGGSDDHTWAESVETSPRFHCVSDTRPAAMLRINTLSSAALSPVAARDAARVPVRPITEQNIRARRSLIGRYGLHG